MICSITGRLNQVLEDRVRLEVGSLEYELLVPEFVRRQIQDRPGETIRFHTSHYLEGNAMQGRLVPRLIGFLDATELEFFELFCTVDKIGVRKAMRALARPVSDIADAIRRGDKRFLADLPGLGRSSAEQIIATLRDKTARFAGPAAAAETTSSPDGTDHQVVEDAYRALLAMGQPPSQAKSQIKDVLADGKRYQSAEEVLAAIFQQR